MVSYSKFVVFVPLVVFLLALCSAAVYNSSSTNVFECGTINEPGLYSLNQSFSALANRCLIINSSDVVIDGQNFSVTGNKTFLSGVFAGEVVNISVNNLNIEGFKIGLLFDGVNNSRLFNLISNGSFGASAFQFYGSSNNNIFERIYGTNGKFGIYFDGSSSGNSLVDSGFSNNSQSDIFLDTYSINNTFLSVSYNSSNEVVTSESQLTREWYVDVNVTAPDFSALGNASVNITNSSGEVVSSGLTNEQGIYRAILGEYENNNGTIYEMNNYTLNVALSGYNPSSSNLTLSGNLYLNTSLSLVVVPSPAGGEVFSASSGGGGGGRNSPALTNLSAQNTTNVFSNLSTNVSNQDNNQTAAQPAPSAGSGITGAVIGTTAGRIGLGVFAFIVLVGIAWFVVAKRRKSNKAVKKK